MRDVATSTLALPTATAKLRPREPIGSQRRQREKIILVRSEILIGRTRGDLTTAGGSTIITKIVGRRPKHP